MLLFNEKHEQLNIKDVKAKLQNLGNIPTPTLQDINTALGSYYTQALKLQGAKYRFKAEFMNASEAAFLPGIGGDILGAIKKFICSILNGSSTEDEILDAVLSALASIIPGGVFIETLAKIVVKYILSLGIGSFCSTTSA